MNNELKINKELLEFLIERKLYPVLNKKGCLYLKTNSKNSINDSEKKMIINQLSSFSESEIIKLREEIKKQIKERKLNRPIKEWIEEERPREMLVRLGAENLPLSKLLAIILRTGKEGLSAEELAKAIINNFGSLRKIDEVSVEELSKFEGVGFVKAVQIKAALELGKRLIKEKATLKRKIKSPDEVIEYVSEYYAPYLRDKNKEFFNVILLDIKNKPLDNIEISKGSSNATVVDTREIIKIASMRSASSVILVHNHPSGETSPSKDDIELTNRIVEACKLVGVKVLDHVIIGKNFDDFFSFAREGLINV